MCEILFDLTLEVAAAVVIEQIPLVERQHKRTARLEYEVDDAQILVADHPRITSIMTTATSAFSRAAAVRSEA